MAVKIFVHERTLDESLTVVEHSVHLNGSDVLTESGELALLNLAHLALGIEHIHVNTIHTEESVGNRTTSVATCGNENIHLLAPFLAYEILQQSSHKSRTYILECQRRSME